MAFTNYTIIPSDSVTVIDGAVAQEVDMTGIPADVHAIQWYGLRGQGTIEYEIDPLTGELPNQGSFTDPAAYSAQTTQAEAIIYAQNNPVTYYVTTSEVVYAGTIYPFGTPIVISTPDPVQPDNTTPLVPPTPEDFQQLYWYDDAWVISSVDPSLSLTEAKNVLNTDVSTSAALQGTTQARIYSPVQLAAAPDITTLPTADYAGMDLGEYQTYLDNEVASMQATVNAATSVSQLYNFNPEVDGNPNP